MKNIYELKTDDKDKYRREFNKLDFTKKINCWRLPSLIVVLFCLTVGAIILGIIEDENYSIMVVETIISYAFWISLIIYAIATTYLDICFYRWLKIKHNIEH